jgi:hypothetical protein
LHRDHGLEVQERLRRDYLQDSGGHHREINILGEAIDAKGHRHTIVGESKAQLSKNDIDRFLRRVVAPLSSGRDVFPLVVAHMISQPDVREYAREKDVALYLSFELEE